MRTKIKAISSHHIDTTITVKGWVRSVRSQKDFSFIVINDGSTLQGLQAIYRADAPNYDATLAALTTGTSVAATG